MLRFAKDDEMTTPLPKNLRRLFFVSASVLAAAALFSGVCDAATYTVGASGSGCTHTTIQAAINAAAANPGVDTVRITRSLTYSGQHIVVNDNQNLTIVGGFATCASTVSDGQKTVISAASTTGRVFNITNTNSSTITLQLLRLTGGNAGSGYGGGLYFFGGGNLELIEMAIDNNRADYGGGIYFEGNSNTAKLIVSNDNLINGNTANVSGGGIYLQHADMTMTAPGSAIVFNSAVNYGGGLRLQGTNGPIGTRATVASNGYSGIAAIYGNSAKWGAGVALQGLVSSGNGLASFTLQGGASIAGNFASVSGGAIYLQNYYGFGDYGDVDAVVSNGILDSNSAPQAAAVYVGYDTEGLGNARGSQFQMSGSMTGNLAIDSNNNPTGGAIVVASESARANFSRSLIQGNVGGTILRADRSDSAVPISLNHSLISGNTLQRNVVEVFNSGPITIRGSTIAGNTISGTTVISSADRLTLEQSIVWQPGKQTAQLGGSSSLDDIIACELPSIGGGSTSIINADPRFIDPAHGDYHLQAASPAVDFAGVTNTTDLEGHVHNQDMTLVADRFGVGDIGAYELQSIGNLVLDPGFAVDLRLWNAVTPGVSTWNSSGAGSAGSVVISMDPGPVGDLIGLSQCVHIPGPGTYQLNGFAYGVGAHNFDRDRVRLGWKFLPNPGGEACIGSAPAQGVVSFPSTLTWSTSTTPGIIDIPPALWSRYSAVEVSLIVQEGGFAIGGTTTGNFDAISLQAFVDQIFADSFE
jgi:hypothetical protein